MENEHAIEFIFTEAVNSELEDSKKQKGSVKKAEMLSKKVIEVEKNNFALNTDSGVKVTVEENKKYMAKISKAYVHKGVEYCTMTIKSLHEDSFSWVAYKDFRFV